MSKLFRLDKAINDIVENWYGWVRAVRDLTNVSLPMEARAKAAKKEEACIKKRYELIDEIDKEFYDG